MGTKPYVDADNSTRTSRSNSYSDLLGGDHLARGGYSCAVGSGSLHLPNFLGPYERVRRSFNRDLQSASSAAGESGTDSPSSAREQRAFKRLHYEERSRFAGGSGSSSVRTRGALEQLLRKIFFPSDYKCLMGWYSKRYAALLKQGDIK